MESSAASTPRRASPLAVTRSLRLRSWGLALLVMSAPGLVRLVAAPSPPLVGLSVACLLILGLASAWCRRQARRVRLQRRHPAEVRGQEPFQVQILVELDGQKPITGLQLSDDFWIGKTLGGSTFSILALVPGQKLTCAYAAACTAGRGWQRLSRVVLTLEDPLGLVRLTVIRQLASEILVLPAARSLRNARLDAPSARTGAEELGAQDAGMGEEFSGTREYRPGDRTRDIHWRASARSGVLVVRENAKMVRPELVVLVHLHRPAPWSASGRERRAPPPAVSGWLFNVSGSKAPPEKSPRLSLQALELCIDAAAAVLEWGPLAGYRTTLHLAALQPVLLDAIQTGEGVREALRQLAVAEPQSTGELEQTLGSLHSRMPSGAMVVVIAPVTSVARPEARASLAALQARGHRVETVVSCPDVDREHWDLPTGELNAAGLGTKVLRSTEDIGRILAPLRTIASPV